MHRKSNFAHAWPLLCCFATVLNASEPRLVKDINVARSTNGGGLNPGVAAGNRYLFSYIQGDTGQEPWITDGSTGGTRNLLDLRPGPEGSSPTGFATDGVRFAFAADDGTSGREPWISDGTASGTRRLADLVPGAGESDPGSFVFAGGNLYFTAQTPGTGRELYVWTGGTAAPALIADLTPGAGSTFQRNWDNNETWRAGFGSNAVFFAHNGNATSIYGSGRMLLAKPDQVVVLASNQVIPNRALPPPRNRLGVEAGGRFHFVGFDGVGLEPWVSDGTPGGTREIADLATAGVGGSLSDSSKPYGLSVLGGHVYFCTDFGNPPGKQNLWRSDGTVITVAVQFDDNSSSGYGPFELATFNGRLWFARVGVGTAAIRGVNFMRSDGTAAGTTVVSTQFTQTHTNDSRSISNLTVAGGRLHFMGGTTATGAEWWSTDGSTFTAMGEVMPGSRTVLANNSTLVHMSGLANGKGLLVAQADGVAKLWSSSGGVATQLLTVEVGPGDGRISGLTAAANGGALFSAASADGIGRVWLTDGTPGGTRIVSDPPCPLSYLGMDMIVERAGALIGNRTWFARDDHPQNAGSTYASVGFEPFVIDGTIADSAATLVANVNTGVGTLYTGTYGNGSNPRAFTGLGGTVFFRASTNVGGDKGEELMSSTGSGANLVMDIRPGSAGSVPQDIGALNGRLLFNADDGMHGREWWIHDPAAGTTQLLKDINPGSAAGEPGPSGTTVRTWVEMGGHAYLRASSGAAGRQLWRTDGTAAGTTLVKIINPSGNAFPVDAYTSNEPNAMGVLGGRIYFKATDGVSGYELWTSDGSAAGTSRLADMNPGAASSNPFGFVVLNGWLYFSADDGVHGRELWRTDGTTVAMVADARPGSDGLNPCYLSRIGGELFFTGNDGVHGIEPWGYRNGAMTLLKDIYPGSQGSQPVSGVARHIPMDGPGIWGEIAVSGNTVYFSAQTPANGAEVWAYTAADVDGSLPPLIVTQPTARSVLVGQTATFGVTVDGVPAPSLQWQRSPDGVSWTAIPGATGTTYTTPATVLGDNGASFRVVATNPVGSTRSQAVALTVSTGGGGSPGDLNGDKVVNITDLTLVTSHFGQTSAHPSWNPLADSNGDGVVNITDLTAVTSHFGMTYQ